MKQSMLKYFISILVLLVTISVTAQEETATDTLKSKDKYGLRLGIDISKPIISIFNDKIKGFEILGDFRIKRNVYAAIELGTYDRDTQEYFFSFNTKGSYIKIGGNYNLYENWPNMNNEIFVGLRYGLSSFSQTLKSYTPNIDGTYFEENTITPNQKFDNLSAQWAEIVIGLKVETLDNVYLGVSIGLKKLVDEKEPTSFKNLYIPGFERVFSNDTGFSFNYSISYLIPIYKKNK
ncbi:MAG: DUF6048 family protein [Urechidicola sp.]